MLADHLTEDDSVLVLQMCSLRTLRAVKAVSKRLRRLGREVICSPAWRSDEANLKELRMCMWTEGSFTSLEMVGHAALADVYGISLCNGVAASASWDGSVKIWDAGSGVCLRPLKPMAHPERRIMGTVLALPAIGSGSIFSIALAPDAIACSNEHALDGRVIVWDYPLDAEAMPVVMRGHRQHAPGLAWAPPGLAAPGRRVLLSGGIDRTLRVWDVTQQHEIACAKEHTRPIRSVTIDQCGHCAAASGGEEGHIRMWSLSPLATLHTFEGHTAAVRAVVLTNSLLISGSLDKTVRTRLAPVGSSAPRLLVPVHTCTPHSLPPACHNARCGCGTCARARSTASCAGRAARCTRSR